MTITCPFPITAAVSSALEDMIDAINSHPLRHSTTQLKFENSRYLISTVTESGKIVEITLEGYLQLEEGIIFLGKRKYAHESRFGATIAFGSVEVLSILLR